MRPEETTTDTVSPRDTDVSGAGLERMTRPACVPGESSAVTSPQARFAFSIALRASDCVMPVTSGTLTVADPDENFTVISAPRRADVPAPGSEDTARPSSTVSDETSSPLTKVSPRSSIAVLASSSDMPDTSGTVAAVAVGEGVGLGLPPGNLPERAMPIRVPARIRRMIKNSHTHQRRRGRLSSAAFSGPACGGAADGGGAGTAGEGAVAEGMAVVLCQVSVAGADTAMPRSAARSSVRI